MLKLESNTDTADRLRSDGSRPIWLDFHGGSVRKSGVDGHRKLAQFEDSHLQDWRCLSRPRNFCWINAIWLHMCKSILFGGQMCTDRSYIVTNPLNSSHEEM
ncbi:hypothetical protein DKX38_023120 [Salix brachista]|uniref:Uncharacterized protein n=1 Tax=Salix brachista TaxID=2182728 RepID=A0A5N5K196_9ROSI|nr:hypothetical protein DKX38_023120 [Salix brachista]